MRPSHRRTLCALVAAVGLPAAGSALAAPAPIDAQRERIREIEAVIVGLDGRAAQARGAEEDAAAEARRLAAEVRQATAELRTAERDRARARRVLAERIVDIYRRGTPDSVLEVLVSAGSISEAASQRVLLDRVAESDGDVLVRVGRLRDRVARVRAALTARRREAARAAVRAAGLRREAEALAERRRAALDEAQGVLARLEAAERRRQAAEAARRAAARRAAAAARAAARRAATPPPPPPPSGGIRVSPRAGTVPGGPSAATLARIADCESDGNPRAVSSNGLYRGKYQFLPSTWASVGGSGDPAAAPEAEQDYRAALLFVRDGPGQWPVCAAFVPR